MAVLPTRQSVVGGSLATIFATVATAVSLAAPAGAQPVEPAGQAQRARAAFGVDSNQGAGHSLRDTLGEQIRLSRTDRSRGATLRTHFVDRAARHGVYYDAASVDYIRLERGRGRYVAPTVEAVVPRDYDVQSITLTENLVHTRMGDRHKVGVEMLGGDGGSVTLAFPDGPGFESLSTVNSGWHYLHTAVGDAESFWKKWRGINDSNSSYDWWAYHRTMNAIPRDISGWDYNVENFGIRSYPYSSSSGYLVAWDQMSPIAPQTVDVGCDTPWSIGIGWGSTSLGYTFQACETYRYDKGSAGDYSLNWTNAAWEDTGSQNGAFYFMVKTKPVSSSKQLYWHDYSYVNFSEYWAGDDGEYILGCASTDSYRVTCS